MLTVSGRGTAGHAITLPIEQHWQVYRYYPDSGGSGEYWNDAQYDWGHSDKVGYGPGVLIGTYAASDFHVNCSDAPFYDLLTRLNFVAPDGTQYQLHDQLYQGAPYYNWSYGSTGTTRNRGKVRTPGGRHLICYTSAVPPGKEEDEPPIAAAKKK